MVKHAFTIKHAADFNAVATANQRVIKPALCAYTIASVEHIAVSFNNVFCDPSAWLTITQGVAASSNHLAKICIETYFK